MFIRINHTTLCSDCLEGNAHIFPLPSHYFKVCALKHVRCSQPPPVQGYFFISFISLYMYFSILQVLKDHDVSQKISVKETLFELSKIYVIADGARRTIAEISGRSKKIADIFGLKLYPKIVWS